MPNPTPYYGEWMVSAIPMELSFNWCTYQCRYCSSVDQGITLSNLRTVRAGDVRIGDALLGFSGVDSPGQKRRWEHTTVTHVFHRKTQGIRAVMESGREVVCTPDHHWFTGRQGDLAYAPLVTARGVPRIGRELHRLALPLMADERSPSHDYMAGYIRGALEGDGSTTPYGAWRLALADHEILARVASYAILLGWGEYEVTPHRVSRDTPSHYRPMTQLYFSAGSAVAQFMNTGFHPNSYDGWRGWMAGIYDAEGSHGTSLRIAQYPQVNPATYQRIGEGFQVLGFQATPEAEAWRLNGGTIAEASFCQLVLPATPRKANPLIGSTLKGCQERDPVVLIEPVGEIEVASFETTTHNYVSGGYLSRNCFANLNSPGRQADVKAISRFYATYHERKTLEARLYQQGYTTCVSNLVDMFAPSNYQEALPIVRMMNDLGLPLQFQTRGTNNLRWRDELLDSLDRPAVWYISVTMLDDDLRKRIEPGAPRIENRFGFIEELRRRGHRVVLGMNPLVREWNPEPNRIIDRAVDLGVEGTWIERLHFNYRQIGNMSEQDKAAMGEDVLKRSQKRRADPVDMAHFLEARRYARSRGLEVFSIGQGVRSDFWNIYHSTYPGGTFYTAQDWVNFCYDNDLTDVLIPFELYAAFFEPHLPQGTYPIDSYVGAVAHHLWWDHHIPAQMTYRDLLAIGWQRYDVKFSPARLPCFAYAARWDDGAADGKPGWIVYVDEHGLPYLVFRPVENVDGTPDESKMPFTDYYTHVDLPADELGETVLEGPVVPVEAEVIL